MSLKNSAISVKATEDCAVCIKHSISIVSETREFDLKRLNKEMKAGGQKVIKLDIIEKGYMDKFKQLKNDAISIIEKHAVNTEIGPIFRRKTASTVMFELNKLKDQFHAHLDNSSALMDVYYGMLARAADKAEDDEIANGVSLAEARHVKECVIAAQPDWEDFRIKMSFGFAYLVVPLELTSFNGEDYSHQADSVVQIRKSALGGTIKEVSEIANRIWRTIEENERKADRKSTPCINQRTVTAVKDLANKLDDLSFLHEKISVIAEWLLSHVVGIQQGEALRGMQYVAFKRLIKTLSDQVVLVESLSADKLAVSLVEAHGATPVIAGDLEQLTIEDVLEDLVSTPAEVVPLTIEKKIPMLASAGRRKSLY